MKAAVFLSQRGCFGLENFAEYVFACVGLQVRIKARDGCFEAIGEDDVAVIRPLRRTAIWPDDEATGDRVTKRPASRARRPSACK